MPVDVQLHADTLQALVDRIMATAPANWVRMYAAFEYKAGGSLTWLTLGVVNLGRSWGFGQAGSDPIAYDLALEHRTACADEPWTTLELEVDYDGAFQVELGYGPVRADDSFDPALQQRLEAYPETWVRERGPSPRG